VKERLFANWLDRINERGYQPFFCLMLVAEGFEILHNTRHSPIEIGKDVIARAPNGDVYAFQLKGHPGGRMRLSEWTSGLDQIRTLTTHHWHSPGTPRPERYFPVFVTNGEVDEEARKAIDEFNDGPFIAGNTQRLQVWARGRLLDGMATVGAPCWPDDPDGTRSLLNALAQSGGDLPDLEQFAAFLSTSLPQDGYSNSNQFDRAAVATLVIAELFYSPQQEVENHYALIAYRSAARSHLIAMSSAQAFPITPFVKSLIDLLRDEILNSMSDLRKEANSSLRGGVLCQGWPGEDFFNFDFRMLLVLSFCGLLEIERERMGRPRDEHTQWFLKLVTQPKRKFDVWGEACIPQLLAIYWGLDVCTGTRASEGLLMGALAHLNHRQLERDDHSNLASSFNGFEEVIAQRMSQILPVDVSLKDDMRRRSGFSMIMTWLLAKRGLKASLRIAWPDVSKIWLVYSQPSGPAGFLAYRDEEATEISTYPASTKQWKDLVSEANTVDTALHSLLWEDPIMLAVHIVVFPHRAIPPAVLHLDAVFSGAGFEAA